MDRREFLKSTGAAAAASSAVATGAAAAEAAPSAPATSRGLQRLRLAIAWQDGFAGPADWAHRLALRIDGLSSGRWHVVPAFDVVDAHAAVERGDADLCFASADALIDAHRAFAYFAGLPGSRGLAPRQLQSWIAIGGGQTLWDDLAGDAGIKPLLSAHSGPRSLMLATEPVETMGALGGRKAYVTGLARDVARGLGLDVVAVTPGGVSDAMHRGALDVAELGGAIVSYAAGLPQAAPYTAGTQINRNGRAFFLGVRRAFWDGLPASDQALLESAAAEEFRLSLAEEEVHGRLLHPAPPAHRVWTIAGELAHAIDRVAEAVVAHAAGSDARSRRIADSHAAFRDTTVDAAATA